MLVSNDRGPSLGDRLFVALQHVLPQHALSRIVLRLTRSRTPALKNALIGSFVRGFQPDLSEAVGTDPLSYASFNDFFTRALRPGARAIAPDAQDLACPVDGTISQMGTLDGARLLQAKGRHYTLEALLGSGACERQEATAPGADAAPDWARSFTGGSFATLYLAPYNYHRIHMPLEGSLRAAWYVPGRLFSVNATTAASVAGLFARNERVVCVFERNGWVFAMVLVGALFVGSMTTVWHGDVTPRRPRRPTSLPLATQRSALTLAKGAEMGRFNMGSTVILLLPPGVAAWRSDLSPGDSIRVGQPLAHLVTPPQ